MSIEKPDTKISRVLTALARGQTFNRFEAERQLHDHCLHSTVAEIQDLGIPVFRHMETVKGYQGCPVRVARYRIALKEDRDRARDVLASMAGKRKPAAATAGQKSGAECESNVRDYPSTSAVEAHPGPRGGGRES